MPTNLISAAPLLRRPLSSHRSCKRRAIIISVIDNLVKGVSGQALQNINLIMGLPETMALMQQAMFP